MKTKSRKNVKNWLPFKINVRNERFKVLTAMTTKSTSFWDVTQSILVKVSWHFGRILLNASFQFSSSSYFYDHHTTRIYTPMAKELWKHKYPNSRYHVKRIDYYEANKVKKAVKQKTLNNSCECVLAQSGAYTLLRFSNAITYRELLQWDECLDDVSDAPLVSITPPAIQK
jgi:hypothetical protein